MLQASRLAHLAATLLVSACATTVPTEPAVIALPGSGKSFEQFNADDVNCRQHAGARAGEIAGASWIDQQRRYDYAYLQCMYAMGHRVPLPGQFTSAPPPGTPPPPPPKPEQVTK
jgi:hypothetical protein